MIADKYIVRGLMRWCLAELTRQGANNSERNDLRELGQITEDDVGVSLP